MKTISMMLISGIVLSLFAAAAFAGSDERKGSPAGFIAKFYGTVERLPEKGWEGTWIVNGREILVTGHTKIEEEYGRVAVGSYVKVEGNYSGKTFTAYEIEVKGDKRAHYDKSHQDKAYNIKFSGAIESIPQDGYEGLWVIGGRKVEVNSKTLIDETGGKALVGSYAEVKGIRTGKTVTAHEIEVRRGR